MRQIRVGDVFEVLKAMRNIQKAEFTADNIEADKQYREDKFIENTEDCKND